MDSERLLQLSLNRVPFLKTLERLNLYDMLDGPERLYRLSVQQLELLIRRKIRAKLPDWAQIERQVRSDEKNLTAGSFNCTFYWDDDYPPLLREIYDPPFLLYYRGFLPDFEKPCVAIVGTRYPSGNGMTAAFQLSHQFGELALSVVSGLAKGIDCSAHEGNMAGGGGTVAVLGNGLSRYYPNTSVKIAHKILNGNGCIMSEYCWETPPLKYNFPARNRIISGLSRSLVIIEAPDRSGALITADYALEQGRDLYVHQRGLSGANGVGCRRLREEGASVIQSATDVTRDWGWDNQGVFEPAEEKDLAILLEEELAGRALVYRGAQVKRNLNG